MAPERALSASALLLLALTNVACGGDEPSHAPDAGPPPAEEQGCKPGETELDDGTCRRAGVPPEACAPGFSPDDAGGCTPILPAEPCGPGAIAIPGDTACREIMPCGDGPWGAIPLDDTTQFVDASFTGTSDGSQANPWTTIADAVDAAGDGDMVAITDGTYVENVVVAFKRLRLWGRCPTNVEIVGSPVSGSTGFALAMARGADGTEVHGVALTGGGTGLVVIGAADVLADRVWVHDTDFNGIELQPDPAARLSGLHLVGSVVEVTLGAGMLVASSNATMEASVIRDTVLEPEAYGRGIDAIQFTPDDIPSTVEVTGSLIERTYNAAVMVVSSMVTISGSLIRDTAPAFDLPSVSSAKAQLADWGGPRTSLTVRSSVLHDAGIGALASDVVVQDTVVRGSRGTIEQGGAGIAVSNYLGEVERASAIVRRCLVEDTQVAGIFVKGSDATIEGTLVRKTLLDDKTRVAGGILLYHDGMAGTRANATVKSCIVEENDCNGVFVIGSDLTFEASESSRNRPREGDGFYGRGVQVQLDELWMPPVSSTATIVGSAFHDNFEEGIAVVGASAKIQGVIVTGTQRGSIDQELGDGIGIMSWAGVVASAEIDSARLENNARAGVASFGAQVALGNSSLECHAFDLDAETFDGKEPSLDDRGGNVCTNCEGEVAACKALSASLGAPAPLDNPE